ncbi:Homeobox protein pknox1 [Saguinus oedipus]|uniref:60S ribosomal protein L7a n=1 Tax=Saguinus oedipus TaxID=9490 RepID=A0ABQ9TYH6_SAGOE|nr:Homeobox protein pknox1 [Saguinus oedipus]
MGVLYCIIREKARLGHLAPRKTCTTVAFTQVNSEDEDTLAKLVEANRTNYNDRYDEICSHWGGSVLGPKHPLFPLLALLFEKCEQSTQGSEGTTSASFDVDIENFVRKQEKEGKPFFCEDPETDNLGQGSKIQSFLCPPKASENSGLPSSLECPERAAPEAPVRCRQHALGHAEVGTTRLCLPAHQMQLNTKARMVKAIQVLRIHLLELEKVNELCKDFCSRYIACLKTKMNSETLLSGEPGSPYSPVQSQVLTLRFWLYLGHHEHLH